MKGELKTGKISNVEYFWSPFRKKSCSLFNFSLEYSGNCICFLLLLLTVIINLYDYSRWNSEPEILQIHNLLPVTAPNDLWIKKIEQRKIKWCMILVCKKVVLQTIITIVFLYNFWNFLTSQKKISTHLKYL